MEIRKILLEIPIKEKICSNLTFEEAINFRDAVDLPSLKCRFLISDPDKQINFVEGINDLTIEVYYMIKHYGSRKALFVAISEQKLAIVKFLISHGLNIHERDELGFSPLIKASFKGYTDIVKFLLENGANINQVDGLDYTSLLWAASRNNLETVKFLLEFNSPGNKINVNATVYGRTVLIIASMSGFTEIVKMLLDHGAKVNIVDSLRKTALSEAMFYKNQEIIEMLKSTS